MALLLLQVPMTRSDSPQAAMTSRTFGPTTTTFSGAFSKVSVRPEFSRVSG